MLDLVPTNPQLLLYLGELLHIVAVVLQCQLSRLQVEAYAEVPSTFSHELEWLTCKSLLAQRLVFDPVLIFVFAIDLYPNEFDGFLFAHLDFDVCIGSFAGFEAEIGLPRLPFFVKRLVSTVRLLGFSIT